MRACTAAVVALTCWIASTATAHDPAALRLRTLQESPGPDGHVATRGVLEAAHCFPGPADCGAVCLPKRTVVDVVRFACGPHANVDCRPSTVLTGVSAPRALTVCGVHHRARQYVPLHIELSMTTPAPTGPAP